MPHMWYILRQMTYLMPCILRHLTRVKVLVAQTAIRLHNVNQAHGLSFSVLPSQKDIPPSLQNIYKELHDDLGCDIPNNGYLKKWADQGVLLLNHGAHCQGSSGKLASGTRLGEVHGCQCIEAANEQDRPIVYMLWGRPGAVGDPYAYKSKASDMDSTASKPAVGLQRLFWP